MRIGLSDGSLFSFKTVYLPPGFDSQSLEIPGREVSPEEAQSLRHASGCYRAERAALQLVARAEQTRSGLSHKLERKGLDSAHIRPALDYLESLEILNDRRFAELYLGGKLRRALSAGRTKLCPRKLFSSLLNRGISADTARRAMKAALDREGEITLLRNYIAAVYAGFEEAPGMMIWQKLKTEGFSQHAINAYKEEL
jgi:regulatory protein